MQKNCCANCEGPVKIERENYRGHFESFVQKGQSPQVTFRWQNLFCSCNRQDSCGKFKDLKARPDNPDHLIKPDVENPEHFFHFISDGTITLRPDLTSAETQRAEETLRIFNLDGKHGALRDQRLGAAAGFLKTASEILELYAEEVSREDCPAFLEEELEITSIPCFCTAIRHTLLPMELHHLSSTPSH